MAAAPLRQFLARAPDSLLLLLQGPHHRRSCLRTGDPTMLVYSTKDVHPRDSMSYWLEVVAAGFVKLAVKLSLIHI